MTTPDLNWQQIAGGTVHSVAVKNDGTLWTWGNNDNGQLGNGTYNGSNSPVKIACPTTFTAETVLPDDGLSVAPNPAGDYIVVQISDNIPSDVFLEIRNTLGELVAPLQDLNRNHRIKTGNLARGVYVLTISSMKGRMSRQFVKN